MFVDGYAHGHIDESLETFFTPWHAILYSGFLACALWFTWLTSRNYKLGWRGTEAIPLGYGTGVVGVLIFFIGGLSDMTWHIIFGIEAGIEALYSPSHLCMFVGGALIMYSPYKRAYLRRSEHPEPAPTLKQLLPGLVSLAFTASFTAFFAMNFWAFAHGYPSQGYDEWAMSLTDENLRHYLYEQGRIQGIANILITNAILIVPIVWLLKSWDPPTGSFTLLLAVPLLFMSVLDGFANVVMIAPGIVAGVVADAVWRRLRGSRYGRYAPLFLGLLSVLLWGLYFLVIEMMAHVAWEPEFWGGAIFLAALSSAVFGKVSNTQNGSAVRSRSVHESFRDNEV